jgi:hypothetical protein
LILFCNLPLFSFAGGWLNGVVYCVLYVLRHVGVRCVKYRALNVFHCMFDPCFHLLSY